MDLGIKGRTALITAASRGIGRACAHSLAAEGCNVSICARGDDELQKTAADIRGQTGAAVFAQATDLSSPEQLGSLVANTHKTFGSIDILVAICGSPKRGTFEDITDEDLVTAFATTVLSLARMVRLVVPHMQAKKWGRVVTVQSRSVRESIPELFASNSTRPGAAGLMKDMSREFGGAGILFNTIVPGRIMTDRFLGGIEASKMSRDDYIRSKIGDVPVQRFGTPEDIAGAVTFLASERASYITGAALPVDGGVIRAV